MGKSFVILSDITCDLSKELREKYDIGFVNGHIRIDGGEDRLSFLDWEEGGMTPEWFYKRLKASPKDFSTSPANIEEWSAEFDKYLKQGIDVLAITLSSKLSGTYDFMALAAKNFEGKYPSAHIRTVDSMRFSSGIGLLTIYASLLRSEGKNVDEVADFIEENKNRVHQAGWLDDLSFVAKKGRLTHAKAFFGTLAGVKPIGEFDYNGLTTVIGKAKGEKKAYKALIEYIKQTIIEPEKQIILIANSDRRKQAETYKKMIEEEIKPKLVYVGDVYPSCGTNVGPGLMAAYYTGKPISRDLSEERKLIEEILKNV